jgi:hypothetical protein
MNALSKELQLQGMQVSIAGSLQTVDLTQLKPQNQKLEQSMAEEHRLSTPLLLDIQYRFR